MITKKKYIENTKKNFFSKNCMLKIDFEQSSLANAVHIQPGKPFKKINEHFQKQNNKVKTAKFFRK